MGSPLRWPQPGFSIAGLPASCEHRELAATLSFSANLGLRPGPFSSINHAIPSFRAN